MTETTQVATTMALYNAMNANKNRTEEIEWHNQPSDSDAIRVAQDK